MNWTELSFGFPKGKSESRGIISAGRIRLNHEIARVCGTFPGHEWIEIPAEAFPSRENAWLEIKRACQGDIGTRDCPPVRASGETICARSLGDSDDSAGHGCRGERQHHQARNVRSKSPGMPGAFVQGSHRGRVAARFFMENHAIASRTWRNWHF